MACSPPQILLLGSLDAALRRDEQLGGKQLRFWALEPGPAAGGQGASAGALADRCAAAGLPRLEASWLAERPLERQLLPPWPAALQLQARALPGLAAVLAFAAEGESREAAAALAAAAAVAAGLVAAGDAVQAWQPPPSWQWAFSRRAAVY